MRGSTVWISFGMRSGTPGAHDSERQSNVTSLAIGAYDGDVNETKGRWWLHALFVVVALLHLLPVWRVEYLPTVDGASHVYNATVLRELTAGTPAFQRVYAADLRPYPNWLGHAFLWLALGVVPPVVAEKLLVSMIILLFLGGCWRLAGVVDLRSRVFALLAMPLAFHVLLQMGFYNYSIGVAIALFAIASAWDARGKGGWRPVAVTAFWLVLCYFGHALPAAVALLFAIVIWAISVAIRGWKSEWRQGVAFVPAIALLLWFVLQPKPPGGHWTWAGAVIWEPLFRVAVLLTFSLRQLTFGTAIGILFGLLIAATLALENIDWKRRRLIVRERDAFLLLTILAIVLFLAAPLSVEEGLLLKARLLIFPYLICLPWLSHRMPRILLAVVFAAVALGNVYFMRECWKRSAKDLAAATVSLSSVAPLHTVVALNFDHSSPHSLLPVFNHTVSYAFAERRLIDLGNYEAAFGFFPVAFREGVRRPPIIDIETHPGDFNPDAYADVLDYIYVWKMPAGAPLASRLAARYNLVADGGDAKLYGRK